MAMGEAYVITNPVGGRGPRSAEMNEEGKSRGVKAALLPPTTTGNGVYCKRLTLNMLLIVAK